jgi:protein SCO1/2
MCRKFTLPILVFVVAVAGCSSQTATTKDKSKTYEIKGKVMEIQAASQEPKVKLDHEAVPGVMDAMKMWFHVENAKLLEGLKEGDQVQGRFKMPDGKYLITELTKR